MKRDLFGDRSVAVLSIERPREAGDLLKTKLLTYCGSAVQNLTTRKNADFAKKEALRLPVEPTAWLAKQPHFSSDRFGRQIASLTNDQKTSTKMD